MKPRRVRGVTLRLACAQLQALPLARAREGLARILEAIRTAGRERVDLLVLPECSYPGYVLLDRKPYRREIASEREALAQIGRAARRARCGIVVGMARRRGGALRNEAVLLDHEGEEIGAYAKLRLWNFDRRWFRGGEELPVFDTPFGRIGMMICADGRNPEIARTLVAKGAWLIADPTAWVGFGPSHAQIRNVQADYMLRIRALENGCWIAAADKCGSELDSVHYAGLSQIVGPDGSVVAKAGPSRPELILADVRQTAPAPFVAALSRADASHLRAKPSRNGMPRTLPPRVWLGVYQGGRATSHRNRAIAIAALAAQAPAVIIQTQTSGKAIAAALRKVRGIRSQTIQGNAMLAPEPARAAALRGADLLAWVAPPSACPVLDIARTRAVENRVYVLVCTRSESDVPACLVHPDGSIGASALVKKPSGFVAAIDAIAARRKEVVPLTQTFADRLPHVYRWLGGSRRVGVS